MVSLLESSVKKMVASGFKGKLIVGTLYRDISSTVNSKGDPVPASTKAYRFEGIRDTFSAVYAAAAGIPITDVRFLIIAGLCDTDPRKDDKILFQGLWYRVRQITAIDPAGATYTLAAFKTEAP